ncbi:MAG: response regulator [Candidatus Omnitrophota bacterium]
MHKILVVDDEQKIANILREFLVKMGFEVMIAPGGAEAIAILHTDTPIDLMLLDMKMPRVVGFDVLKEMKRINKKVKTVILTGSVDADLYHDDLAKLDYKSEDIVYKPVDLFNLLDAVKKKLEIA